MPGKTLLQETEQRMVGMSAVRRREKLGGRFVDEIEDPPKIQSDR